MCKDEGFQGVNAQKKKVRMTIKVTYVWQLSDFSKIT